MKVLVINTGSSSIKFALFHMPEGKELASGLVERIGEEKGSIHVRTENGSDSEELNIPNHQLGLHLVAQRLMSDKYHIISSPDEVIAIGHRVVHGGEKFKKTTIISEEVKDKIKELFGLAPLHNPPNFEGIEVAETVFQKSVQVAVFDTAFHQTLPPKAFHYAIPKYLYEEYGIRVYGFHGTSHRYITRVTAEYLGIPLEKANFITIHLGNGASMAAVKNGHSIDTTLGMTPLTGLVMGTRVGDIDPGVIFYLEEEKGYSIEKVKNILNKQSGLKGLSGDNDLRAISNRALEGDEDAQLALDVYSYRIRKYIGAYIAVIGKIDAIIFTAGVGENSQLVRKMVCHEMEHLGLHLDEVKNAQVSHSIREINTSESPVKIMVTPTNEELEIARQTYVLLNE
jgi:acetate kinase